MTTISTSWILAQPLHDKLKDIKKSLYPRTVTVLDDDRLIYGTLDESYEAFRLDSMRKGKMNVTKIDYFQDRIEEANTIIATALKMEENLRNKVYEEIEKLQEITTPEIKFHAVYRLADEVKETANTLIQKEVDVPEKTSTKTKPVINYFSYPFTPTQQKKLYEGLVKGEFLHIETDYNHFCYVFGGSALTNGAIPFKPLQWCKNTQDLKMLIDTILPNEKNKWIITVECFLVNNTAIKYNSIKNLNPSHKDNPMSEKYFIDLKMQINQ